MKSKKDTVFFWFVTALAIGFFIWSDWYEKGVKGGTLSFIAFMMLGIIYYLRDKYQ